MTKYTRTNVIMRPLIKYLKLLWEELNAYDCARKIDSGPFV
jgi:hypothetical protein